MDPLISQGEDSSDSSDTDIGYRGFLSNLEEDGTSYVFKSAATIFEYEKEPETSTVQLPLRSSGRKSGFRNQRKLITKTKARVKIEGENEHLYNGFEDLRGQFSARKNGRVLVNSLKLGKTDIEPCYEFFLNHVEYLADGSFLLNSDDGMAIKYGEHLVLPSKKTRVVDEDSVFETEAYSDSSADVVKSNEINDKTRSRSSKASFRERLEANSNRSFDEEEFQNLLRKMSSHAPLKRDRQLRRVVKHYDADGMGRSYFDHYPDFFNTIKMACCDNHRFKQLLGFFFWLEV